MPRGHAVIDITSDPLAARANRWRTVRRIGVPVVGVVLMIAVIIVIALQANRANRRGALALSDDVLVSLDARIAQQVTTYFGIPTRALAIGETLAGRELPGEPRRALVEKFSMGTLQQIPQVADFIFADLDGNFMMVRRNENGGLDTKLIRNSPGPRQVFWIRRDSDGAEVGHEEDPADTFDPRTRPWYSGALATNGVFWTDVYVFFTGNEPGITASTRYQTVEGRTFVIGVDITLASLSKFLAGLKIGETGRAMIIDGDGRIVAYPRAERIVKQSGSEAITARINEIGDAPAAAAYDRFRIRGPGRATLTFDGKRYLAMLSPLTAIGRNWSIMIVLPEDDFVGFVGRNNRMALVMSLAIVGIAVLLAALLFRQGLRGDRAARLARERTQAMARQTAALDRLSDEDDLFDPTRNRLPDALTETIADLTGARRTSLWYFQRDGALLRCADSFDSQASVHAAGLEIQRGELPQFFRHLVEGGEIDVADAARDPRTAELHRLMLAPLGSRSLLVLPIRRRERVVGGIWLEDPVDSMGSRQFLRVLASIAALRADDASGEAQQHDAATGAAVGEPEEVCARSPDLTQRGLDAITLGKALYPEISVLVIRIDDPTAPADSAREPELVDAIVRAVQELAAEQEIPYLKLVGCDIVGAAGFVAGDQTAAARIANTAIASRDRIFELFQLHGRMPNFRFGIDTGIAIGRSVGTEPGLFNLWGEAVQNARTMAATALPGAIQTSEAAYHRLSHSFLFRPRGTFYLPLVGRAQTFVLAGRL
jgi:adenylate cyclase